MCINISANLEKNMIRLKKLKSTPQLITVALYVLLFAAVIFLMQHVQYLLNSDIRINLAEVVTQNKDVITSKLSLEVNNLDSVASKILDRLKNEKNPSYSRLQDIFLEYSRDHQEIIGKTLYIANKDGEVLFPDGTNNFSVAGRRYFKLSIQGVQNISDRIISRKNGEEIFVISVPLEYQGEIIGTIQKFFSPQEMYDLCSVSLFSSKGYMYIINNEGYILLSSRQNDKEYSHETENYFRMIYSQGNKEESAEIQEDIKNNSSGFVETKVDGEKTFSAYTPIEGIHDWYLISSVATSAVSSNVSTVVKMFYFILSFVVLVFGISLFAFLSYKNRQQAALEKIAFVDSVTNGNTYNKFTVDLKNVLQSTEDLRKFYLLKFDIDNFKYINNFYGFDFGDKVLKHVYHTINSQLLNKESIARISSDHFVVLLEEVSNERLRILIESIKNKDDLTLYFSAGIYVITDHNESVSLMVDKASTAAEASKGSLNKKVELYSEKFDQLMIRNEQLKRAVKQALADDEMIPFFQPKVNVNTLKLVGAEALVRWRTKDGKLIPPNDFIPLCEKTGIITELDGIIFEKVLQFLQRNLLAGVECVPISVNFSRLHLLNNHFFDNIMKKVTKYNIPPHLIELEITESAMFDNYEMISSFISQLHGGGFSISMDDFGSGYSSLNMLKDIPIDILKIDKEFLNKTINSDRQKIIFSAIAQMANQLKIKVVVEGVEIIENVKLMQEVGFSIAQGYYFAKPMEEAIFEKIYREGVL